MDAYRLDDRVAIVTGSSRGIGRAVAERLARVGASVVVNARTAAAAEAVAADIVGAGGRAVAIAADVADPGDARRLVAGAVEVFGRLDVLVNNAGVGVLAPSAELSLDQWQHVLAVNLTGPFLCSQAALPHLASAGGGVIVNVGSILGAVGLPLRAAYVAAKHGLAGLTKVLAAEWADQGVRVVTVEPSYVETDMLLEKMGQAGLTREQLSRRAPLQRLCRPEEVGHAVAYLSSDAASFITGSSLRVDGGWVGYGGW